MHGFHTPQYYRHLDLNVELPFKAERMRARLEPPAEVDVKVQLADLPPGSPPFEPGYRWLGGGGFLFDAPKIGRFRVVDGRSITVEPFMQATLSEIELVLFSEAFAALLWQRGDVPLHASAVCCEGQSLLVTGPSGAGKSALCAQLMARGAKLIADDLCRYTVGLSPDNWLIPSGGSSLMVWRDQLAALPAMAATQLRPGLDKFAVQFETEQLSAATNELSGIVIIERGTDFSTQTLVERTAFKALHELIFRPDYASNSSRKAAFAALVSLSLSVPVCRIIRPDGIQTEQQVADAAAEFLSAIPKT